MAFNHLLISTMKDKKGQVGLITGIVMGIAGLIIGAVIAFLIVSTLSDANLLTAGRTTSTVTNTTEAWLNVSGYNLVNESTVAHIVPGTYVITAIWNASLGGEYNISFDIGNATVSNTGVVLNATAEAEAYNVSLSYTYNIESHEETATDNLAANFTKGVDNVSSKIPTVLLIGAIVLILTILGILVAVWAGMRSNGAGGI